MNPGGEVTIAANLVRYQRKGVKRELAAVVEILGVQYGTNLDLNSYYRALSRFDIARDLLDAVGVLDEAATQGDITLDLGRWSRLILKTLESEYIAELTRLQDAEAEGFELPLRDLPDLGDLVAGVRRKVGGRPKDAEPRLSRETATKRTRGHGCRE
jgi:hypothetical protein